MFRGLANHSYIAHFPTEQTGYVISENYGDAYKTTDGGATWQKLSDALQPPAVAAFRDVQFLDENTGFASFQDLQGCPTNCRELTSLLATRDGGQTWQLIRGDFQATLNQIYFRSATEGVAAASTLVPVSGGTFDATTGMLRTTDGGKTWQKIDGVTPGKLLGQLFFLNPQTGFLQGLNGTFYRSLDGGKSWETFPNVFNSWQYQFVTADKGFAGAADGLYRTANGGRAWVQVFDGFTELIGFASEQEGFFVRTIKEYPNDVPDYDAEILHTTDGGATWTRGEAVHNLDVYRPFQFPSARVGYGTVGNAIVKLSKQ